MSSSPPLPSLLGNGLAKAANIHLPPSTSESGSHNPKDDMIPDIYNKYASLVDFDMLSQYNADMDILLIFAGLFTAIVTAFALSSLGDLKDNYAATSALLLSILVAQSMGQTIVFQPPPPFQPDYATIVVNSLWIASIIVSLSAALFAILCKQWLREYSARLSPIPSVRAFQRHCRYRAFQNWQVPTIIALLPALVHAAVGLFFAGLIVYLRPINNTVLIVASAMIGVTTAFYLAFFLLPLFTTAPFITPLERLFAHLAMRAGWLTFRLVSDGLLLFLGSFLLCLGNLNTPFNTLIRNDRYLRDISQKAEMERFVKQQNSPMEDGEPSRAEFLSWFLHSPLVYSEIQEALTKLFMLKSPDALRTLGDNGASVMLLNRMEAMCFRHEGPSLITGVIKERLPFILSCLNFHIRVASNQDTRSIDNPFWAKEPTELIAPLLKVTDGMDRLHVLAASTWMIESKDSDGHGRDYRVQIRNQLLAHIDGAVELPEDVVVLLVQDPDPLDEFAPDVIRLLQKHLDRSSLPSMSTIREILLHLYNCRENFYDRRKGYASASYLITYLMENMENSRPQLLQLLRSLPQKPDSDSPQLAKCLLGFLQHSPSPDESFILDILKTISKAPEYCQMDDHALVRLVNFHRSQTSDNLRQASIVALASFTESIVNSGTPNHKIAKNMRTIRDTITDYLIVSLDRFTERKTLVPYLYTLNLCAEPTIWGKRTKDAVLLPYLVKVVSTPSDPQSDIVVIQYTLRLISLILHDDIGSASVMTDSLDLWKQLVVHDDIWIRWLSFDIVKRVAYHISREDSRKLFRVVRDDVERRLNSATTEKFVDCQWEELMDATQMATVLNPMVALSREVNGDIGLSGIREVLDGVPEGMICEKSVLHDIPSLKPFDNWASENLPNTFVA